MQSQYIMGTGGPVDINQMAIHAAMDLYDIEDRQGCFEKVVMVGRAVIRDEAERRGK